jgi:hypothetical protein
MTYFVHIDKQMGCKCFGGIFCPHFQDGPRRVDKAKDGEIKIPPKFGVICPPQRHRITEDGTFYLHLYTSLYYVVRPALRNPHYYAENAV